MLNALLPLAVRTITHPKEAAAQVVQFQMPRSTLWSVLALVVVLNAIAYQLSLLITPPQQPLPALFSSPFLFATLIGAGLILSVYSITYAGRFIGGKGTLDTIMLLLVWLQFLRFLLQMLTFILIPLVPGLAGMLVLCASLYGMWILLQFIDFAHEHNSLAASFGTLILSGLGIMLGLAILLSLLGVQNMGLTPYV